MSVTGAVDEYGMPSFGQSCRIGWCFVPISDLRDICVSNAENGTKRRQEEK